MPISQGVLQGMMNPGAQGIGQISTALSGIKESKRLKAASELAQQKIDMQAAKDKQMAFHQDETRNIQQQNVDAKVAENLRMGKHQQAIRALKQQQLGLQISAHDQESKLNNLEIKKRANEDIIQRAKFQVGFANAYRETVRKNPKILEEPLAAIVLQRDLAEGKPLPDYINNQLLSPEHIYQMAQTAQATIDEFNKAEAQSAWQYTVDTARKIQAAVDAGEEPDSGDVAALKALERGPTVQINTPGTGGQGWLAAQDIYKTMQVGGAELAGNMENEEAFITMLNSRANTIQEKAEAMARKEGNPDLAIPYGLAVMQAKKDIKDAGMIEDSGEAVGDIPLVPEWGEKALNWASSQFKKRFTFNPEGTKEEPVTLPEGLSEEYLQATLVSSGLDDTEENREAVIEAWQNQK